MGTTRIIRCFPLLWKFAAACFAVGVIGGGGAPVEGAEITATPFVGFRAEYNDNVLFSRQSPVSDGVGRAAAGVDLKAGTERLKLDVQSVLEAERFWDQTDLDTENWRLKSEGVYWLTPRFRLLGELSYTKDTTLEEEIEEIGVARSRDDRFRYRARGGGFFRFSRRTNLVFNYTVTRTEFDGEENTDSDGHVLAGFMFHRLNDNRDVLSLGAVLSRNLTEFRDRDTLSARVGYRHRFTELLEFQGRAGIRYTMRDFVSPQRKDERTVGGLLDVNLGRQLETFGGRLGYQRDLRTSSAGEDLEVDRLYANLQYEWRPRWVLGLEGSLFFTREDGGESGTEEDRRFFEVASSVTYRLTESHDVALGYSYSRETDRTRDENPSADRNRVWLSVQFRFPAAL